MACDATSLPFRTASFGRVICSEVLEHIEQDEGVMKEMSRILKPGGQLFLTVPVRPELYGFDDRFVGHYRRYERKKLIELLSQHQFSGFEASPVLGPLEKWIMERITRIFYRLNGERKSSYFHQDGVFLRVLAWVLFPLYLFLNAGAGVCVALQARWGAAGQAVTLLVQCRKQP